MARRTLFEELDEAVQSLLVHPDAPLPRSSSQLAPLVRIAAELRGLPRQEFKSQLKKELSMSASHPVSSVPAIRPGFHTLTPYLAVHPAPELADFVEQAFGAVELGRTQAPNGAWHIEVRLGDSMVMIGGGPSFQGPGFPTALWYFVEDVDAVYRRALDLGATSLSEPVDQPYGMREAGVKDLAGNFWYISRHLGASHLPEGFHTITPYLHPKAADPLLDFLQHAFGAEVLSRHASPEGRVMHAQVRIGDSQLAMGEPAGVYQTMPTMFYVYVDDVDSLYERAIQAGGTTMFAPALQPYGDRVGALSDPFGNRWYIATHVKDVPR